jgi:hypothetical protein
MNIRQELDTQSFFIDQDDDFALLYHNIDSLTGDLTSENPISMPMENTKETSNSNGM